MDIDSEERLTLIHQTTSRDAESTPNYTSIKSVSDLENAAIVEGGALSLNSPEAFGLFMQYGAIGVIYGLIPALSYPIFTIYLNLEGYQTSSYGVLVVIGWSFKIFFGALSDCFPIYGYRRKPYMLIGWVITMICLGIMAFSSLGEPYCNREKTKYCGVPLDQVPESELKYFNFAAPTRGTTYILLSMFVSFGYVLADCAADAMVVEYAQREPLQFRGRVQTAIYTVRTLTGILALCVTAFGMNGKNYNGSFSFSLAPNIPYAICLVPCILVVYSTLFFVVEKKAPATPFIEYVAKFWNLLQQRAVWQICGFRFVMDGLHSIGVTTGGPISAYWAKVEPLNDSLSHILGNVIYATILITMGKYGLNWNWRWCIAFGTVGIMLVDGLVMFLTIWDVVRNQWFFTGVALADQVPMGIRFIVASYCAVEVADVGTEGATYGMITSIQNIMGPFGSRDTTKVRWDVTYVYLISYTCKSASLIGLLLLPPQKAAIQELKRKGEKSKFAGLLILAAFFIAQSFAIVSSIMSIYPSTKCYRIAGGNGIVNPKTGLCPQ